MKKIIVFTFRTFKHRAKLEERFGEVIVIGKLKQDIERLADLVEKEQPDFVLGVASAKRSRFEAIAVNDFHGKQVQQAGVAKLSLHIPVKDVLPVATRATNSFCNYAAYRLSMQLKERGVDVPVAFVHIEAQDLSKLHVLAR